MCLGIITSCSQTMLARVWVDEWPWHPSRLEDPGSNVLPNRKPAIIAVHETAGLDEVARHPFTEHRGWRYGPLFDIQILLPMTDSAARTFPG